MKTILTILIYIFISSGVYAGEMNDNANGKPAPKSETKRISKAAHKHKKEQTANLEEYKMDNGEYYTPKRKLRVNHHYNKPKNSSRNKKR